MIVAKSLNFAKGTVVVFNGGYVGYKLFARWTKAGIFYVTRLKAMPITGTSGSAAPQEKPWQRIEGSGDPA